MKNEVLNFIAEMAAALAVVDAFIPRAEHYVKANAKHPNNEEEGTDETQQQHQQYTNRLTTELPDKKHLHLPHYYPPPLQQQQHPYPNTSTDQLKSADPTNALHRSGQSQESLLDKLLINKPPRKRHSLPQWD